MMEENVRVLGAGRQGAVEIGQRRGVLAALEALASGGRHIARQTGLRFQFLDKRAGALADLGECRDLLRFALGVWIALLLPKDRLDARFIGVARGKRKNLRVAAEIPGHRHRHGEP